MVDLFNVFNLKPILIQIFKLYFKKVIFHKKMNLRTEIFSAHNCSKVFTKTRRAFIYKIKSIKCSSWWSMFAVCKVMNYPATFQALNSCVCNLESDARTTFATVLVCGMSASDGLRQCAVQSVSVA